MTNYGGVAGGMLRSFIERIERLEEEKKAIAEDIRDVYSEAKANGLDAKIMRQIVKIRKMDTADRQEAEALLDTYMHALGMTPIEMVIKSVAAKGADMEVVISDGTAQAAE